jgi:hypothetical protein
MISKSFPVHFRFVSKFSTTGIPLSGNKTNAPGGAGALVLEQ